MHLEVRLSIEWRLAFRRRYQNAFGQLELRGAYDQGNDRDPRPRTGIDTASDVNV